MPDGAKSRIKHLIDACEHHYAASKNGVRSKYSEILMNAARAFITKGAKKEKAYLRMVDNIGEFEDSDQEASLYEIRRHRVLREKLKIDH